MAFLKRIDYRIVVIAAVFIYYVLQWHTLNGLVKYLDSCSELFCDFTRHFYPAGQAVFATHLPAEDFWYSPFAALLFGLISWLPIEAAVLAWAVIQLIAALVLYLIPCHDLLHDRPWLQVMYTLLFVTSVPVLHNFKWGQVSLPLTACVVAALYLYRRRHTSWAALCLALAIAVKAYPILFVWYFILKRDIKFVLKCGAFTLAFAVAIPVLVLGFEDTLQYYKTVGELAQVGASGWVRRDFNSQFLPNVVWRWLKIRRSNVALNVVQIAGYTMSAIGAGVLYGRAKFRQIDEIYWVSAILFTLTPLWIDTSWSHYLTYLPLVHIFVLKLILDDQPIRFITALKLIIWGVSAMLCQIIWVVLTGSWNNYASSGFLFIGNLLLLALVCVELWPRCWPRAGRLGRAEAPMAAHQLSGT